MARRSAIAEKYTAEELARLDPDIRAEIIASGGGETRSAVPTSEDTARRDEARAQQEFEQAAGPRRIKRAKEEAPLDKTPTEILILAHNKPAGIEIVNDAEEGQPDNFVERERRFDRKERVHVPKWIADLLVQKDMAVFI